jgi:hypothetical protein
MKTKDGEEKAEAITNTEDVFSCQGWHYYLVNNLAVLERENVELNLILPSELRALPFEIQRVRSQGDRVEAVLKLNHWLFRYFAPTLQLVYDSKSRRLVEYRGISNILDREGKRQDVRIVYKYSRAAQVRRGGARSVQEVTDAEFSHDVDQLRNLKRQF